MHRQIFDGDETVGHAFMGLDQHRNEKQPVRRASMLLGFHAIKALQIMTPCPFDMLIAPEHEISFGFIEDNMFSFYQDAFMPLNIIKSYEQHLSAQMRLFHCEKSLTWTTDEVCSERQAAFSSQAHSVTCLRSVTGPGCVCLAARCRDSAQSCR